MSGPPARRAARLSAGGAPVPVHPVHRNHRLANHVRLICRRRLFVGVNFGNGVKVITCDGVVYLQADTVEAEAFLENLRKKLREMGNFGLEDSE